MSGARIPKVHVRFDKTLQSGIWLCPGCGHENHEYLFSETIGAMEREVKDLQKVGCIECTKKFETD